MYLNNLGRWRFFSEKKLPEVVTKNHLNKNVNQKRKQVIFYFEDDILMKEKGIRFFFNDRKSWMKAIKMWNHTNNYAVILTRQDLFYLLPNPLNPCPNPEHSTLRCSNSWKNKKKPELFSWLLQAEVRMELVWIVDFLQSIQLFFYFGWKIERKSWRQFQGKKELFMKTLMIAPFY